MSSGDPQKRVQIHYLMINTRHNNHPRKLELSRIKKIWRTMESKGKVTIEFDSPEISLFVSETKPARLKEFLSTLNNPHTIGSRSAENIQQKEQQKNKNGPHSSLSHEWEAASSKANLWSNSVAVEARRHLTIRHRKEYERAVFSPNLKSLDVHLIGLRYVDNKWFSLRSLVRLSLSGNLLGKDWTARSWRRFCAIGRLERLLMFDLSHNPLQQIPEFFIDSLPTTLNILLLQGCGLHALSNRISRLQNLEHLNLNTNPMEELPEDLCLLPNLRKLYISGMPNLRFLPATMFSTGYGYGRYAELDVSGSLFAREKEPTARKLNAGDGAADEIPSLVVLAAAAVFNNPQLTEPRSHLLRPSTLDCLPRSMHSQMRQWLLRCADCQRLYVPGVHQRQEFFHRFQLRQFVSGSLHGSTNAYVRLQICQHCSAWKCASKRRGVKRGREENEAAENDAPPTIRPAPAKAQNSAA